MLRRLHPAGGPALCDTLVECGEARYLAGEHVAGLDLMREAYRYAKAAFAPDDPRRKRVAQYLITYLERSGLEAELAEVRRAETP